MSNNEPTDAMSAYQNALDKASFGPVKNRVQKAFYGTDIEGIGNQLPIANNNTGYVFFTRPCLNLTNGNMANNKRMMPFMRSDPNSIEAAVRATLDPLSSRGKLDDDDSDTHIISNLIDPLNPFIAILSNSIVSLSGWPEAVLDAYTSTPGMRNETQSKPDGYVINYGSYSLNATFKNVVGGGVQKLVQLWQLYMSSTHIGEMYRYPQFIANSEFDFNTRIYRLIMDPSKKYVMEIAACGAAWPSVDTSPNNFNFNIDNPTIDEEKEISYRFNCDGFLHNDPSLIYEFNAHCGIFNTAMMPSDPEDDVGEEKVKGEVFDFKNQGSKLAAIKSIANMGKDLFSTSPGKRTDLLIRLSGEEQKKEFNNKAYPRIDPETMELLWYANPADQDKIEQ